MGSYACVQEGSAELLIHINKVRSWARSGGREFNIMVGKGVEGPGFEARKQPKKNSKRD